jgi:hypothetical protein
VTRLNPLNKFVPLLKMEEQADGSLMVYGLVTEQKPDLDREVCDYVTTKAFYQMRTAERWALTSKIAGMEPSLMAARGQHDPKQAIGAGRSIDFSDALKTIKMGFQIVDGEAVKKWKAGVYVGFSQGGGYVDKWADPEFAGCTRYTCDPMEVSSVDAPCLPSALVESMKGRTVALAKAAGAGTVQVPLQTSPVDTPAAVSVSGFEAMLKSRPMVEMCLKSNAYSIEDRRSVMSAARKVGLALSARDEALVQKACARISVHKGLYEVGALGRLIEDLSWLCMQTEWERDVEDDGSKVPDDLRSSWMALLGSFKDMAAEEANEAAAAAPKGEKTMKITSAADLTKAAKTLMDHLEKHSEMHKAFHEKLEGTVAKDHPLMKSSQAMMDHCDKCMKAAKDTMGEEQPAEETEKALPAADLSKAATDRFAAIEKAQAAQDAKLDTIVKALEKVPAGGAPHSGADPVKKAASPFDVLESQPAGAGGAAVTH